MTTPRRRLLADVFAGRPAERVPTGFWWHYYSVPPALQAIQDRMNGPSKIPAWLALRLVPNNPFTGYRDDRIAARVVAGHKRDYLAERPDFVKIMSDGFFAHPGIVDGAVAGPADLAKIRPVGAGHRWIRRQVEMVGELTDFFGDEIMSFYTVFSPVQQLRLFIEYIVKDVAGFQQMLYAAPAEVAHAAEIIAADTNLLLTALKAETGIDGVFYSVQSAQHPGCDLTHHDRWIRPSDLAVLGTADRLWSRNILHICGYEDYRNDLSRYTDYPAAAYNWAVHTEGVSLAEGKELFDGVVIGGFDNGPAGVLAAGTAAETAAATAELIAAAGADRLILGADCTIAPDTPTDRLALIRYAAAAADVMPS